ncbi:MAG: hypothetical protein V4813_05870 [Gemmatimonadota bacterium]
MPPTPPLDPTSLRQHGLFVSSLAVGTLVAAVLMLQWRLAFVLPLSLWVAEAFGPLR